MKKFKFIMLCLAIALSSCSKTGLVKINELAITQVLQSQNLAEQKSMYSLLNQNEKAEVWQKKYRKLLMTKNFTTDQQIFISNLEKKIIPEIFLSPNNSNKIVFDDREIKSTAIKLFGVADAYSLLVMIRESKNIREPDAVAVGSSCSCSTSSDWCTGESTCHAGGCNTKSGCGAFLLYTCNGDCKVDVIMYN